MMTGGIIVMAVMMGIMLLLGGHGKMGNKHGEHASHEAAPSSATAVSSATVVSTATAQNAP